MNLVCIMIGSEYCNLKVESVNVKGSWLAPLYTFFFINKKLNNRPENL